MTDSTTETRDEKPNEVKDVDENPLEPTESRPESYPTGIKLVLILLSIYLSVFLVALDRTIIATALPKITDQFQSFGDVGWVSIPISLTLNCTASLVPMLMTHDAR